MGIQEIIDYHKKAGLELTNFATNEDLEINHRLHYTKRATFHLDAVEVLESYKKKVSDQGWKDGGFMNGR